ncbi:MAG TPA: DinB family protein [Bryobacterales bacterium]|nr:DinB family protein [Bryobacterales bacterium]
MPADITQQFLASSRQTFATWLARIEKCVDQLTPEQIWWRGADNSNAVGNLMLHLAGNVRQWIVSGVGDTADMRNRDAEFAQREALPANDLRERLRAAVRDADAVLGRLTTDDLTQPRRIQNYDVTVLEAIHHVTEHFALHAGQILYATKLLTGADLGFYRHLAPKK